MFVCQTCKDVVGPGVQQHAVVIRRRVRKYQPRFNFRHEISDHGGQGTEIVQEVHVCKHCRDHLEYLVKSQGDHERNEVSNHVTTSRQKPQHNTNGRFVRK